MKKKKTLSTQLTFVISFIVLLIVGVFWMANNTLLEKYYVYNKEKRDACGIQNGGPGCKK